MGDKKSKSGIMLLLGAVFGAITAIFLSTDKEGKTKKAVAPKVKKVKKVISESVQRDKLVEIFGEDSEKYFDAVDDLRAKAIVQLEKLKDAGEKIDKKKYQKVIDDLVAKFTKKEDVTPGQVKKLTTYLANDIKKFKEELKS